MKDYQMLILQAKSCSWRQLFLCLMLAMPVAIFAQGVSIQLSGTDISERESFQISAVATNEKLTDCGEFPEVSGFRKASVSQQSNMSYVNGRMSASASVVQHYTPTKQGKFKLPAFTVRINGKMVQHPGGEIIVRAAPQQPRATHDPFAGDPNYGIWDYGRSQPQKPEFKEVPDNAFLALTADKDEVYIGEGFTATLAFYVPMRDRNTIDFDASIGEQLAEQLKAIKPGNCWEEPYNITRINEERIEINKQWYMRYKLYQATYFPLNVGEVNFPSATINMRKLMVSNQMTVFGPRTQETMKPFSSKPVAVKVKELPPHPLRDQVNVGVFALVEDMPVIEGKTGQNLSYIFAIQGQGNIAAIKEPTILQKNDSVGIFTANTQQQVSKGEGVVYGLKQFEYYIEPQEPGQYHLKDYFQWIYFNAKEERYDTLKANKHFTATGESIKNLSVDSEDVSGVYAQLNSADTGLASINSAFPWVWAGNVGLLLLAVGTVYMAWYKKSA